jgi:hypothetical protein
MKYTLPHHSSCKELVKNLEEETMRGAVSLWLYKENKLWD